MMHALEVDFNHATGRVTVVEVGDRKQTLTEDADQLALEVGDDVSVRVDGGMTHIETMTREPLIARIGKDGRTVEVRTARKPSAATE